MVTGRYGVPLLGLAKSIYFFLADSQKKNDAYFAWRFACCFQQAARFLLGENTSCHLVCLTALQSAHRWTVEKRNTESE